MLLGALCIAVVRADAAGDSRLQSIQVVAVAADVHSIVVRDGRAQLARYVEGAAIAGTTWHLVRVSGDSATLTCAQRLRGSAVEMLVHVGDHINLDVQTARLVDAQQVRAVPARTNVRAAKRDAVPSR